MPQGQIPHSAVPYKQLSFDLEWKPGCLKFQTPKNARRKLIALIVIVAICCVTVLYSCLNCNLGCTSFCDYVTISQSNANESTSRGHIGVPEQRLPQCIIIGVRKAGTRALLSYLNIHSDIVQHSKEMHFFNVKERYNSGLEYYRTQMPFTYEDQLTLEKTPAYFTDPWVPERIYRMNNSIRLLLIVRDPVTRLISDYEQLAGKRKAKERLTPLEEMVLDENGDVDTDYKPVQISMYYKHFSHWLEYFDKSQIHVVDGDGFVSNPYPHLYEVESFLGLGHKIPQDLFFYNETKGFYCFRGFTSPCLGASKGRPHSYVDPQVIKKLQDFFRPKNQIFFDMIGHTFDWP